MCSDSSSGTGESNPSCQISSKNKHMKKVELFCYTDGSNIVADSDEDAALENWEENVGGTYMFFQIVINVPDTPVAEITLPETVPVVTVSTKGEVVS